MNEQVRRIIDTAKNESFRMWHDHIGTEHLLLAIAVDNDSVAAKALTENGASFDQLARQADQTLARGKVQGHAERPQTPRAHEVIKIAAREAARYGKSYIEIEHVALALLKQEGSAARELLTKLGVDIDKVIEIVERDAAKR